MKFKAKVQERKQSGTLKRLQRWIFLPSKLKVEKGDEIKVEVRE